MTTHAHNVPYPFLDKRHPLDKDLEEEQ